MKDDEYIPAMKYRWLAPLYDPLVRLMGDAKRKRRLIELCDISGGQRVLDIGCGTGTLLQMLKESEPGAELYGLDGDPEILQIARSKFKRRNLNIRLDLGMAFEVPYADDYFDRVVSSYVFHHLSRENKQRSFQESLRVLKPGGTLILSDFGPPMGSLTRFVSVILSRHEQITDNMEGLLPEFAKLAGFQELETLEHNNTLFGTVYIFRGKKSNLV